ncbi:hypothetical protein [Alistipes sp.]|uniref:hypothetical protein n=1 Tax=Alistipes sp. TaxID=1872444 RepID=UPI003AF14CDE
MSVALFLLLAACSVCALALLYRIVRSRNKRRLLGDMRGPSCGPLDGVGVSVLVSGTGEMKQIENLLSVEYARYEVVVVLDARRYPQQFAALVARYCLIRVDHTPSEELPADGVRMMGRSRKRCFRRLVLLDRAQDTPAGDFDAAAAAAAYDYVLPVRAGQYLVPGAVERLVAELGEEPAGRIRAIRAPLGEPGVLLSREAVVEAGGFANRPLRSIPSRHRKTLWEPVFCTPDVRCVRTHRLIRVLGLLLAAAIAAAVWSGRWPLAAVLLTAALVWAAAGCAREALSDLPAACFGGWRRWRNLWQF